VQLGAPRVRWRGRQNPRDTFYTKAGGTGNSSTSSNAIYARRRSSVPFARIQRTLQGGGSSTLTRPATFRHWSSRDVNGNASFVIAVGSKLPLCRDSLFFVDMAKVPSSFSREYARSVLDTNHIDGASVQSINFSVITRGEFHCVTAIDRPLHCPEPLVLPWRTIIDRYGQ
jgi:hypothetical protein